MSEQNYRRALGAVVAICILLAVALGYVLLRDHRTLPTDENDPIIAKGPDATAQPMTMKDHASADSAPTLTPVQLSPQRLQAIGAETIRGVLWQRQAGVQPAFDAGFRHICGMFVAHGNLPMLQPIRILVSEMNWNAGTNMFSGAGPLRTRPALSY